jgi:serine/threonine-protein kinase
MSAAHISPRIVGRYALYGEIASGGMATVYLGRLLGQVGFSRTVAIKCLHPQFAKDPDFMSMFLDEARLAARIQHPNAVQTLDVLATESDLFLVMEYLQGESLSRLIKASVSKGQAIPLPIVTSIICGMLHGLHAVHEARDEHGVPLGIVHRDVSPQNIMVGVDGVARVLDFGVAKAAGRIQTTRDGQLKGKLSYMAPEQVRGGQAITRQTDIYSATLVLWEALTGHRVREGENEAQILGRALDANVPPPSRFVPNLPPTIDQIVACGTHLDPRYRFSSAREMALNLEACIRPATSTEVGAWVEQLAHQKLSKRAQQVAELESSSAVKVPARLSGGEGYLGYDISPHPAVRESGPVSSPGSPGAYPGTNPNLQAQWKSGGSGPYAQHPSMPAPSSISQVSQPSQPSMVSQSQPSLGSQSQSHASAMYQQQPQPAPQRLGWIMVLIGMSTAALVVATFCAIILVRSSSRGASASHAIAPATSTPPASTPDVTSTTVPDALQAQQPQPPFTAAANATGAGTIIPPTISIPPTVAASALPTAAPRAAVSKPKPTTKADCDPPYTRDAAGVKTYKMECLK